MITNPPKDVVEVASHDLLADGSPHIRRSGSRCGKCYWVLYDGHWCQNPDCPSGEADQWSRIVGLSNAEAQILIQANRKNTRGDEVNVWKSRAQAHEENYNQMLKRVDALVAENELWQQEAKRWRDMYIEYDEMLEKDLEKAKTRIANVTSKIKSLEKEINDEKY